MRVLALVVVAGALGVLAPPVPTAAADTAVESTTYQPPVTADIVDPFRPPRHQFGSGNRGLEYNSAVGDPVRASATGFVRFAGQVGGILHVTLEHPDGRLSSYSGLAAIRVMVGQEVGQGEVIALADGNLHFGVRDHGQYVDPEALMAGAVTVRLIPESPLVPVSDWRTPGEERAALALIAMQMNRGGGGLLGGLGSFLGGSLDLLGSAADRSLDLGWGVLQLPVVGALWLGDSVVTVGGVVIPIVWHVAPYVVARYNPIWSGIIFDIAIPLLQGEMPPIIGFVIDLRTLPLRVGLRGIQWWRHRSDCTPAGVHPPPPDGERVAVLVAGLDSTSERASIGDLRTAELGYETHEVIGFSYSGGRTPEVFDRRPDADEDVAWPLSPFDPLADIESNPYGSTDSSTDLFERGALLADLLTEVAASDPDATVDLYAHSQGGLVVRLALAELRRRPGGQAVIDRLGLVATMGSPHSGSDLAAIAVVLAGSLDTSAALRTADWATGMSLHPRGTNVGDLARWSEFISDLAAEDLPDGPDYLTLGNRADYIVTDGRARLPGVTHVTLNGTSPFAHSTLPGQDDTTRELALALAGLSPTCQGFGDFLVDVAVTEGIQMAVSGLGAAVSIRNLPVSPLDVLEPLVRW